MLYHYESENDRRLFAVYRPTPHTIALLNVAGLVAIQAMALAHSFYHPVLDSAEHECTVCVHGNTLDFVVPTSATVPITERVTQRGARLIPHRIALVRPASGHIRGPPFVLSGT